MSDKEFGSGVRVVTATCIEMRNAIIKLAGPREWHDNRKSWLSKAAVTAGVSYRTAKAFFYAEGHEPRSSAVDRVRAAVRRMEREETLKEQAARDDYQALLGRVAQLEAALLATDSEFFRDAIEALRAATHQSGSQASDMDGADSALDGGSLE